MIKITSKSQSKKTPEFVSMNTADDQFSQGEELFNNGNYEEALPYFDKAIELKTTYLTDACYFKACILRRHCREYEEALEYLNKVLAVKPDDTNALSEKICVLKELFRYDEVLSVFDELISLEPDNIDYYQGKWSVLMGLKRYEELLMLSEKVIALDALLGYNMKGIALNEQGKNQEAIVWFNKTLALDPNHQTALNSKAYALKRMGKTKEAIACFDKLISVNINNGESLVSKGKCFEDLGKPKEAMALYDKALTVDKECSAYDAKIDLFKSQNKYDEAVKVCDMAWKNRGRYYYMNLKGSNLQKAGKLQEALKCYNESVSLDPDDMFFLCSRGTCLYDLGREKEGLEDFKKAQELLENGKIDLRMPEKYINFVKETLASVLALQDLEDKAEAQMKQLDKNSAASQRFLKQFELLKAEKNKATNNALTKLTDKDTSEMQKRIEEMDKITAAFQEKINELNEIQKELSIVKTDIKDVKTAVTELKNDFADMKEEFDNKMDDFTKKLDSTLNKLDLSPENQVKLKEYFRAFVETFSSAHVTAQVVDSGQVVLDVGNSMTSILSTLASFAPFMGDALSKGITSIGEFLKSKEMKTNARKLKGLAADASELSQLVGKSGYEIVLNKSKQQLIIHVTEEDLEAASKSFFKQLTSFVQKLQEEVDVFLYTKLYKTSAARLGHNDANRIIEEWIKGEITPFNTQKVIVQKTIEGHQDETVAVPEGEFSDSRGGSRCCNMF